MRKKRVVKKRGAVKKKSAKAAKPKKAIKKKRTVPKVDLTSREREVFRLLSLGCTVNEAAAILTLAPSTADNHKARLMKKLGVNKAALLTRLAIAMGVTEVYETLTPAEKRRSGRSKDGWN